MDMKNTVGMQRIGSIFIVPVSFHNIYITLKNHLEYLSYAKHHANNQLHRKTPYFILLVKFKDLEICSNLRYICIALKAI